MKSEGQAWALGQLADIVKAAVGSLEVIEIVEPTDEGGAVSVSLSVDCAGYQRKLGGVPLKARERLLLKDSFEFSA